MGRTATLNAHGNEAEDDGFTFNGGTAEDWHNTYADLGHNCPRPLVTVEYYASNHP